MKTGEQDEPREDQPRPGGQPEEIPPGTVVTGSDQPGGGGTQPLEFTEDGKPIPPGPKGEPSRRP